VFEGLLANAPDYSDFQLACALQGFNLQRTEDQIEAGYKILPLLAKVKNPMRKAHLLVKYADVLHTPEEALRQSLQQFEKRQPKASYHNNTTAVVNTVTDYTGEPAQGFVHTALSHQNQPNAFSSLQDTYQAEGYRKPFKPKAKNGKYLTAEERLAQQASLENHTHYRQRLLQQQNLATLEQTALAQLLTTTASFSQLKAELAPLENHWHYQPFGLLWQLMKVAPSVSVIRGHLPAPLHPLWDGLLFEAERWHEVLALNTENDVEALQQVKTALVQSVQRWQERKTQEGLLARNKALKQDFQALPTAVETNDLMIEDPAIEAGQQAQYEVSSIELQYAIVESHPSGNSS
jgi:DNA primase